MDVTSVAVDIRLDVSSSSSKDLEQQPESAPGSGPPLVVTSNGSKAEKQKFHTLSKPSSDSLVIELEEPHTTHQDKHSSPSSMTALSPVIVKNKSTNPLFSKSVDAQLQDSPSVIEQKAMKQALTPKAVKDLNVKSSEKNRPDDILEEDEPSKSQGCPSIPIEPTTTEANGDCSVTAADIPFLPAPTQQLKATPTTPPPTAAGVNEAFSSSPTSSSNASNNLQEGPDRTYGKGACLPSVYALIVESAYQYSNKQSLPPKEMGSPPTSAYAIAIPSKEDSDAPLRIVTSTNLQLPSVKEDEKRKSPPPTTPPTTDDNDIDSVLLKKHSKEESRPDKDEPKLKHKRNPGISCNTGKSGRSMPYNMPKNNMETEPPSSGQNKKRKSLSGDDENTDSSITSSSMEFWVKRRDTNDAGKKPRFREDIARGKRINHGSWTTEELSIFLLGLQMYGKDWNQVATLVKTRSYIQVRIEKRRGRVR